MSERIYPELPIPITNPTIPISFVVVRFSNQYQYNILQSDCIKDPLNELITVDNTGNLFYKNLTEAIKVGMDQAKHKIIAVVHDDVLLPKGWQYRFEESLETLEQEDPYWGVLGSVGWSVDNQLRGHFSDPRMYVKTFNETMYNQILRLDEQILIFNRDRMIQLDPNLPGIHHIGFDVVASALQSGMKSYAIDAPTIHKFANETGELIKSGLESGKIQRRKTLTYLADRSFCNDYIMQKWPGFVPHDYVANDRIIKEDDNETIDLTEEPVIILKTFESNLNLLNAFCVDLGIKQDIKGAGVQIAYQDLELVIYKGIIRKHYVNDVWPLLKIIEQFKWYAKKILEHDKSRSTWGFSITESNFLLPEIKLAFPKARFIHVIRDPLKTCFDNLPKSVSLNNEIGRITLPLAYDYFKIPRSRILTDPQTVRMAVTRFHQHELFSNFLLDVPKENQIQILMEDLISKQANTIDKVCNWLDIPRKTKSFEKINVPGDFIVNDLNQSQRVISEIKRFLHPLRKKYHYV